MRLITPSAALQAALAQVPAGQKPGPIGVAVSGGGDSLALMALMADWAGAQGATLHAVTVDHGLRAGAASEAAQVALQAEALGVPHQILRWTGKVQGNLQDAARRARRTLVADWARGLGLGAVALGHTQDDQAETVLMRLARGSGVDGLAAMAPVRHSDGMVWLRPLLDVPRAALREELQARGLTWVEDPSNADPRFDRVRARQALAVLAPLGLDAARLAETAAAMRLARQALGQVAAGAVATLMRMTDTGDVAIDSAGLAAQPQDLRERLVAQVLCTLSGNPYRPRRAALRRALGQGRATLHGCLIERDAQATRITREWKAAPASRAALQAVWDGRWLLSAPPTADPAAIAELELRALGPEGIAQCPAGARPGWPRASLMATPAVWSGSTLVAAPLAGWPQGWQARLRQSLADIRAGVLID